MNKKSKVIINERLVQNLVTKQFPKWKNLPIKAVAHQGWDNRTFRLGEELLVRMPSSKEHIYQLEKEQLWLPKLAPHLPCLIPVPITLGHPDAGYPWKWSIYKWLNGETALYGQINNLDIFARDLANFIIALQQIDATDGPLPGVQNFHRGGLLLNYDIETRKAISLLGRKIDQEAALDLWEKAINTEYIDQPIWVHGDISPGNLLVTNGQLSAVIDFGQLAIGDPACDLTIAWTMFYDKSRETFIQSIPLKQDIWIRARAWGLWKALIIAAGIIETNVMEKQKAFRVIEEVMRVK